MTLAGALFSMKRREPQGQLRMPGTKNE